MIRRKLIASTVRQLLSEMDITHPPVDVRMIAERKGAIVVDEPLEDQSFSGFLYRRSDARPVIGTNSNHPITRKRFTIAHELAHMLIHPKTGVHLDQVVVQMRDSKSSMGMDEEEMEANRLAAELLMPESFLATDIAAMGTVHADDSQAIEILADKYEVSVQAMTIRLSALGLICM